MTGTWASERKALATHRFCDFARPHGSSPFSGHSLWELKSPNLLQDALSVWLPLRSLLADNVDTVRTDGVDTSVVGAVTDSSSALYYKVDAAWKALVDDADEAGAKLNGLAVATGPRMEFPHGCCQNR